MPADDIAAEIRAALMRGEVKPGTLLSQVNLAERFGVSRIPIRDALHVLAGEGLLEIERNRGARAIGLGPAAVEEIYSLRIMLECDLMSRACEQMTGHALAAIERARRHADVDAATPTWGAADWKFHKAIYEVAGRPRQLAIVEALRRTCQMSIAQYPALPRRRSVWLEGHRQMVEGLKAGDRASCVDALREHLDAAAGNLQALMRESAPLSGGAAY
jgi:DNA-binding GntR family transcriptional regulator